MNAQAKLSIAATITSCLTVLAALPYEKDMLQIFPPTWAPYIAIVGAVSTVILRVIKASKQ